MCCSNVASNELPAIKKGAPHVQGVVGYKHVPLHPNLQDRRRTDRPHHGDQSRL